MFRSLSITLLLLALWPAALLAQGTVRGKITDESGEALVGAVVSLKAHPRVAALSDLDGNYSLRVPDTLPQRLVVSYISYQTIEQDIAPLRANAVIIRPFTLVSQNNLAEVEVTVKQVKANEYYMENVKKKSANTIDYISSETMKKTGDPNVVAAVARVSGVASSGGLITVRGIGDRYVKTMLNGSRIPTLDPFTNNIKLDIFPASLVDNVIITKTASPDLPGDWAGAYLSVETKDYPDKLAVNVESQFGYNAQTTFKNFLSSDRSSTDWLGFDTGLRDKSHDNFQAPAGVRLQTTTYEEMVALGVGDYYKSIGVNGWIDGQDKDNLYFKLGLVQLGLLPAVQINDPTAFAKAQAVYTEVYKPKAFEKIYPDGTDFNNGMANNWTTRLRKAPINFSQSFSVGNQTTLFKKPLGYMLGMRYGSFVRYDPHGISQRVSDEKLGYQNELNDMALMSRQTNGWSALVNLAYKMNGNNSLSLLFMPNFSGTNDVSKYSTASDSTNAQEGRTIQSQFYEQRRQLIYQVKSEHYLPGVKSKIDFNASYTKGNSMVPDFKMVEYGFFRDNTTGQVMGYTFGATAGNGIRRFYRYLSEDVLDTRLAAEVPLGDQGKIGVRKIKFGGAYLQNDRRQDLYEYVVANGNAVYAPVLNGEGGLDSILGPDHFVVSNHVVDYVYQKNNNAIIGKSTVSSAFAMLDYALLSRLRVSGGLRMESATLFSDVLAYHQLGYKRNDKRRANEAGFPYVNPADIHDTRFLPSVNLIGKLRDDDKAQVNLRLNYSQTVARPSLRELNDAAVFDNEFRTLIYGNSDLKTVSIRNYDLRAESYFNNGDNISLSVFYKDFTNHIEVGFGNSGLTWNNVGHSTVRGIELEGRKKLLRSLEFRLNATLVRSNSEVVRTVFEVVDGVKNYLPVDTINRPMFGQAPYIVNGILSYSADSLGLIVTASYNVQGPRLVIAGIVKGRPDVYETPRHLIDLKLSKTLGKHFMISITVRDLLNQPVRRAYKYNSGGQIKDLPVGPRDYDKFRYGTNYLLSLAYRL